MVCSLVACPTVLDTRHVRGAHALSAFKQGRMELTEALTLVMLLHRVHRVRGLVFRPTVDAWQ